MSARKSSTLLQRKLHIHKLNQSSNPKSKESPIPSPFVEVGLESGSLSQQNLLYLQRTIGNHAVTNLLGRRQQGKGNSGTDTTHSYINSFAISSVPQIQIQRVNEDLVENGGVKVTGGRAAKSWSLAGKSKKPLAIVEGTMDLGAGLANVEVHVHLNPTDPLGTFTGANVRRKGMTYGFAYWAGGLVDDTAWLKKILDAGIPNWDKKDTWTAIDNEDQIKWQGPANAGWKFDEAMRVRDRKLNTNYRVKFTINKKKTNTQTRQAVEELCGTRVKVTVSKKDNSHWEVTLTYDNEQVAYEQLDEDEYNIKTRWSEATFTEDAKTAEWK